MGIKTRSADSRRYDGQLYGMPTSCIPAAFRNVLGWLNVTGDINFKLWSRLYTKRCNLHTSTPDGVICLHASTTSDIICIPVHQMM
jgi:hypothetical protein